MALRYRLGPNTQLQVITPFYIALNPVNIINSDTLLNSRRFMGNKRRLEITGPHFYDKQFSRHVRTFAYLRAFTSAHNMHSPTFYVA